MIRTKAFSTGLAAALALAVGVTAINCSHKSATEEGHVALALTVPGGYTINTVAYNVYSGGTASGTPYLVGAFDVSHDGSAIQLDIALPAGQYIVTLAADTVGTPSRHFTGTSATFTITAGLVNTTVPPVSLSDAGAAGSNPGVVVITGNVQPGNNAPVIDSIVLAPATTGVWAADRSHGQGPRRGLG